MLECVYLVLLKLHWIGSSLLHFVYKRSHWIIIGSAVQVSTFLHYHNELSQGALSARHFNDNFFYKDFLMALKIVVQCFLQFSWRFFSVFRQKDISPIFFFSAKPFAFECFILGILRRHVKFLSFSAKE